jgi:hypothetical protein
MSKIVDEEFGKSCNQDSTLHAVSVAWTICMNKKQDLKFLFRDSMDESGLFNSWLNKLFEDALSIHKCQEKYIKKLKLPFYLQFKYLNDESLPKKDSKKQNKKCTNKSKEEESKIRSIVKVIGYNSRRFDVNVFIRKITDRKNFN